MHITLLIVVLGIYFAGMVGIGLVGRKYAATYDSFVSAGRNAGVLMIIGSAVGSQIGNGFVVGGAGAAASSGISGAWYGIACGLGYLGIAVVLNKI
ncbi:MAG: sodium:solute symporter family protein, partial [Lawsonibacter sp.]